MRIFMFAAALRAESTNKKLINIAADLAKKAGHEVDLAEFSEFMLPLYDGDMETNQGIPQIAKDFAARMQQANAVIISSPEYNHSTPGTLKNLIDWVSRIQPSPWKNQYILLLSASPAMVGGNRGLWATRIPLECCGSFVYPDMFSLSNAYTAFDQNNQLLDKKLTERLQGLIKDFAQHAAQCTR
ncbi:MAG: NAD(P)H-dependent oxidoreductase [Legionellales bacterium]